MNNIFFILVILVILIPSATAPINEVIGDQTNNPSSPSVWTNYEQIARIQHDLQGNGIQYTTISGNSMLPTLRDGQYVFANYKPDLSKINVGDIIIYKGWLPAPIIHRVIWRNESHFQTKGDNNALPDSIYSIKNIKGVIIGILY